MSRKNKYGLGLFKQITTFEDRKRRYEWLSYLQAEAYKAYVATVAIRGKSGGATIDEVLTSHYNYLRNAFLHQLKEATDKHERRRLRTALIAVRLFKENNKQLVEKVTK